MLSFRIALGIFALSASGCFFQPKLYSEARRPGQAQQAAPEDAAPLARPDTASVIVGATLVIPVLANDSDPDGDALTILNVGEATYGTTEILDGQIRYVAGSLANVEDVFGYTISDGRGEIATSSVTVSILPLPNRAPVAVNDTVTVLPSQAILISVLANDSDPDGDALTLMSITAPGRGTAAISGSQVSYLAPATPNVSTTFTYVASDGRGGTATGTVTVNISANPNRPPVAQNDASTVVYGQSVSVQVLANDSDPDGDSLTISSATNPSRGTISISGMNIVYTPSGNFASTDAFTYTVRDPLGLTATATVSVVVTLPPNRAPIALNDATAVEQGQSVTVNVLTNDSDPDGQAIQVVSATGATKGTTVISASTVTYTAGASASGADSFQYTIRDSGGLTATATVNVTITLPVDRFEAARMVLQTYCTSCHNPAGSVPSARLDYATEAEFVASGLVVAGNAAGSRLVQRTRFVGTSGAANMPPALGTFNEVEAAKLSNWINGMTASPDMGDFPTHQGFSCNATAEPSVSVLKRLKKVEYVNSLQDLMRTKAYTETEIAAAMNAAGAPIGSIPKDAHSTMAGMDESLTALHVDKYFEAAEIIATELTNTAAKLQKIGGACATTIPVSATCRDAFLREVGRLTYRRPLLEPDDLSYLQGIFNDASNGGFRNTLVVMLTTPYFLHHFENGANAQAGTSYLYPLTGYEIAARLSYTFWQSMPDSALFAAAADGSLLTTAGFAAQLDRVVGSAKTVTGVRTFFNEWLKLEDTPAINNLPSTQSFIATLQVSGINMASVRQEMIDEMYSLTGHYFANQGTYRDLLLSDASFARAGNLASAIYNVAPWGGSPTNLVRFPAGTRAGILTRAQTSFTGSAKTRPIIRGADIRRRILCDTLLPPADNNTPATAMITPDQTTRQYVEAITQIPGTACAGCHTTQINPLGFALENYDSFGRDREQEIVYYSDTSGQAGMELRRATVDSATIPLIFSQDSRTSMDGVTLSRMIADSLKGEACFSRQWFRYSFRKSEDLTGGDACMVQQMFQQATQGGQRDIKSVMRAIATHPHFKLRKGGAP
ncbi:MAG: Ig-like domain-containing protein [Bacteriovoracia bacterium]